MAEVNIKGIKLIIGLGNPGKEYEKTYHNIGFLIMDFMIKNVLSASNTLKFQSPNLKNFSYFKNNSLIFAKPLTFMNNSGIAIKEILKYFSIKPEETLIIHDDSDIKLGNFKISINRGSAGHKGIESIIKNLNTKSFHRLRIGIGKNNSITKTKKVDAGLSSGTKRVKAEEIVLKKINKKDMEIIKKSIKTINIKN
ncbi:aminoacyl-tRNA hydrolase [Candidatus Wolfebacteria bacterium]|nr:aminoacyl-tRNA hydrolase [Candidatus Wolfebacteria bacterium]